MREYYLGEARRDGFFGSGTMSQDEGDEKSFLEEMYRRMNGYPSRRERRYRRENRRERRREMRREMGEQMSFAELSENYGGQNSSVRQFFEKIQSGYGDMEPEEKEELMMTMKKLHASMEGEHFNEQYARQQVAMMFHIEGNKKYVGEKFDMHKAKEVMEMFRSVIPQDTTLGDVYVAINTQYHDCIVLYKSWFGSNVEHKIMESAIDFWFKDDDCPEGKVWDYFKDK